MKRKIILGSIVVIAVAVMIGILIGKYHVSDNDVSTNEHACKVCGEMAWSQVNGCMDPLICQACGAEGTVPGHIWGEEKEDGTVTCIKCYLSKGEFEAMEENTLATMPAPTAMPVVTEESSESTVTEEVDTVATEQPEVTGTGEGEKSQEAPDKIPTIGDVSNIEANEQVIIDTIIRDIGVYNQFIYDHCGYSEDEYGPGPHAKEADPNLDIFCLQIGIMEYMDMLINYISGNYNPDEPLFLWLQMDYYTPIEEQIEEIRGCVFTQTPYNQSHPEDYQNYTMILKNFLEDGHPDIETIDSISLEWIDEYMLFDTRLCDVIATFTSNGETYKCYLNAVSASADGAHYTVLDLERLE